MAGERRPTSDTTQTRLQPEARLRLRFDKLQSFVDRFRPHISLAGMFLETPQPKKPGAVVEIEVQLNDGTRVCQAIGEVAWVRLSATAAGQPAGMAIRFQSIDDKSRELVLKIFEEQLKAGGEPFAIEKVPPEAVAAPPADDLAPGEDPAATHQRPAVDDGPGADATMLLGADDAESFRAPWGPELPGLPDEVLEPVAEGDVSGMVREDLLSDPDEAGFGADLELLSLDPEPVPAKVFPPPDEDDAHAPLFDDSGHDLLADLELPSGQAQDMAGGEADVDFTDLGEIPDDEPPEPEKPREVGLEYDDTVIETPVLGDPDPPLGDDLDFAPTAGSVPPSAPTPFDGLRGLDAEPAGLSSGPGPSYLGADAMIPPEEDWEGEGTSWDAELDETTSQRFMGNLRLAIAESKGRLIAALVVLAVVVAAAVFKDQVLELAGLGPEEPLPAPTMGNRPPLPRPGAAAGDEVPTEPSAADDALATTGSEGMAIDVVAQDAAAGQDVEPPPPTPSAADLRPPRTTPSAADLRPPPAAAPPPTAAPPPAAAPPPPSPSASPASAVVDVTFDQIAQGTQVIVWLDGDLSPSRVDHQDLSYDPMKEQVVLLGIDQPFKGRVDVGTLELDRIRTGLHEGQLRLVFDLASDVMTLGDIRPRGNRLEILVRRR